MSAAHDVSTCRRLEQQLSAYVDKELDAVHALEVDEHLGGCKHCSEHVALLSATRGSLKYVSQCKAPAALRERVCRVMLDDSDSDRDSDAAAASSPPLSERPARPQRMRYIMPLAAAATMLLVFGTVWLQEKFGNPTQTEKATARVTASFEHLLDELVSLHAHPLPPETTDPEGLRRFDPYLGLRLHKPNFGKRDVRYLGARMMPRQSAMLQYMLHRPQDKRRVTMYVFNTKSTPLRATRLKRRHMGTRRVLVGNVRGYSVAASERNGVGYALASDLDDTESIELLLNAE